MRFWWVNHKQTFRQEFGGGYVWCPKLKQNGRPNHFYETMREVRAGDVILSYANAAVQGFGIARSDCYSCPRPEDFGMTGNLWDKRGWRVDVVFNRFPLPLRTADHMNRLAMYLPDKYAPIRPDGHGNQGAYLAEVDERLVLAIGSIADPVLASFVQGGAYMEDKNGLRDPISPVLEWEDLEQRRIESGSDIPETERRALVYARRGQGQFKLNVARFERGCRVTHVENPVHLIASHIKPWREASNEERLFGGNGLLLTPSVDHLFDRGYISFADDGELLISRRADRLSLQRMGIPVEGGFGVGAFNSDQKFFLNYHRKEVFLQSAV